MSGKSEAQFSEGLEIRPIPQNLGDYEIGFAIDMQTEPGPNFYLVKPDLGLEQVATNEFAGFVFQRVGEQTPTALILAQIWLRKNRVTNPPTRLHIRTDLDSRRGPLGAVSSYDFKSQIGRYEPSAHHANTPRSTIDL